MRWKIQVVTGSSRTRAMSTSLAVLASFGLTGCLAPTPVQPAGAVTLVGDSRCSIDWEVIEAAAEQVTGVDVVLDCVPGATSFNHPRLVQRMLEGPVIFMFGSNELFYMSHGNYTAAQVLSQWQALDNNAPYGACWVSMGSVGIEQPNTGAVQMWDAWLPSRVPFGDYTDTQRHTSAMLDDFHYMAGGVGYEVLGNMVGQCALDHLL